MFDITQIEKDARAELNKETAEKAKGRIKAHIRAMTAARLVVTNLEREYDVLLKEIADDGV